MSEPTGGLAGETVQRQAIIDTALILSRSGLSPGRSGNVSSRWRNGMLITPSGIAYDDIAVDDVVFVDPSGIVAEGGRKPSSEWRFHLSVYAARGDVGAVVHTHSRHATALACAHIPIPAFHYMVAVGGGNDIPLVPYATFGSEELSRYVSSGLRERNACLMANHGQISVGATLRAALELAQEIENLASQYIEVLKLDAVHVLDEAEMEAVLKRFKTYGQSALKAN